jgi:radical SAM superfamily enzyme YgiQ (UPF0313 family)
LNKKVLFITPPFTQLNTPYPATGYLKGFLNTKGFESNQVDLGIEVILKLFSHDGFTTLFKKLEKTEVELTANSYRISNLKNDYINTIDPVIRFLQNKNPTLAYSICDRSYLPEASRFSQIEDLEWAFGTMGIHDRARHLATLYLEDIADLIKETFDPHFGFSRYAERLGRSASSFNELQHSLEAPETLVSSILLELLGEKITKWNPDIVCMTVPFPGNLYGALKCGQFLKNHHPEVKIIIGGGYVNTELRDLVDERVFDYLDFMCLDDGEAPLLFLLEHLSGNRELNQLKRVFSLSNGVVCYHNGAEELDVPQRETGTPDYSDLPIHEYLSVIEIINPMHRLWSDGRWNKLTLAHGCYWGKCTFCDVTLDYIKRYEPVTASLLCDRIEEIIEQTQQNGFHFVDEAAPPALLLDLALEIIRRKITIVWWTNIRFEKSFTPDLCRLLKASGCIAISGGLEVASDRLLALMKKGVTVSQVARVADAFTEAGIMVHAYLMYGFPTQTSQETVDSLEMVRQLFEIGVIQSGFWHRFTMTAHSPVGKNPEAYDVEPIGPEFGGFAKNDLEHKDPSGCDHALFSDGLKASLFNYMHGICLDFPLSEWFDFETPPTRIPEDYIENSLNEFQEKTPRPNAIVVWLGNTPSISIFKPQDEESDGPEEIAELIYYNKREEWLLQINVEIGQFLFGIMPKLTIDSDEPYTFSQLIKDFNDAQIGDFDDLLESDLWAQLKSNGLLIL